MSDECLRSRSDSRYDDENDRMSVYQQVRRIVLPAVICIARPARSIDVLAVGPFFVAGSLTADVSAESRSGAAQVAGRHDTADPGSAGPDSAGPDSARPDSARPDSAPAAWIERRAVGAATNWDTAKPAAGSAPGQSNIAEWANGKATARTASSRA